MAAHRILLLALIAGGAVCPAQRLLAVHLAEDIESVSDRLGITDRGSALIDTHWTNRETQKLLHLAQARIDKQPRDYAGHALRYVVQLELAKDRQAARSAAQESIRLLHREPLAVAKFVRFALLSEPRSADFQLARMALAGVVPDHRHHAAVRTTNLRALLGAGRVKEALATNKTIAEDLAKDPGGLTDLLHVICDSPHRDRFKGIAAQALSRLVALDAQSERTRLVRFRVLFELLGKPEVARPIARQILARVPDSDLNDWTWDLLTLRRNAGRYLPLALHAAKRLAKIEELAYHEYDTMAMAWFLNGHVEKAVALQEKSLSLGGKRDAAYVRRLAYYRAALAKRRARK